MNDYTTTPEPNDDNRRIAFLSTLRLRDPGLADIYLGARQLIGTDGPGRATFLAHAVRELRNRLPEALGATKRPPRLDYRKRIEQIRRLWPSGQNNLPGPASLDGPVPVPLAAATEIARLIEDDAAVARVFETQFLEMCTAVTGEDLQWGGNARLAKAWTAIEMHGIAHNASATNAFDKARRAFDTLESFLLNLFDFAHRREPVIRGLAEAANPSNVLEHILRLYTLHDFDVYFGTLKDPAVFETLERQNIFVLNDYSLNYWPQAAYLSNIVDREPKRVSRLLKKFPVPPPGVTRQFLDITMRLPDDTFVKTARKAPWLAGPPSIYFLDKLKLMLSRLASLNEEGALFRVAAPLFYLSVEEAREPALRWDRARAVPVIDRYSFEAVLNWAPELLSTVSLPRTLDLLRKTLDRAIEVEQYDYDHAGYWYSNMLDENTRRFDTKTELTGALLDLAMSVAKTSLSSMVEFFDAVTPNTTLYRRIADAVIARHGTPLQAAERIASSSEWHFGEERVVLMERGFGFLLPEQQTELLDREYVRQRAIIASHLAENGQAVDDMERYLDGAVARYFGKAVELAPEPYRSRLATAATPAEDPEVRPVLDLEQMEKVGVENIGRALEGANTGAWSIGGSLRAFVERHGSAFLESETAFSAIPNYFMGWALNGLDGFRRGAATSDRRVVALANAALARAVVAGSSDDAETKEIARHIAQSCGPLLVEEAKRATTADEIAGLLKSVSSLQAINLPESRTPASPWSAVVTSRGHATAIAVEITGRLLLAAHNHKVSTEGVKAAYESFMPTKIYAVRAELAQCFKWFAVVFPPDAERWAQSLYFSDDENANRAAWSGYVTSSRPTLLMHRLLRESYRRRIEDFAQRTASKSEPSDERIVREQTLWHVWIFLANDIETLEESDSLSSQMLRSILDVDLDHLLGEIGASLERESGDDAERLGRVYQRAMLLWERVEDEVANHRRSPEVLTSLSRWATSPLSPDWRFAKLERLAVQDASGRRDSWLFVKAAVQLGEVDCLRSLKFLQHLLQPPRGEILTAVQQMARPLLLAGVQKSGDTALIANTINSYLVTNGRPSLLDDTTA